MKLTIERDEIHIQAESLMEVAFIEDTLGLTRAGQAIRLERVDTNGGLGIFDLRATSRRRGRRAGRGSRV